MAEVSNMGMLPLRLLGRKLRPSSRLGWILTGTSPIRNYVRCRTHRHNWRNEAVKLRAIAISACKRLDEYGVEMPDRVAEWWKTQKSLALMGRVRKSEFGVLQMAIAAEEAREEALHRED
jgi:hypothetical protein